MFTRHPDLILRLCSDASTLLWTLFDGDRAAFCSTCLRSRMQRHEGDNLA